MSVDNEKLRQLRIDAENRCRQNQINSERQREQRIQDEIEASIRSILSKVPREVEDAAKSGHHEYRVYRMESSSVEGVERREKAIFVAVERGCKAQGYKTYRTKGCNAWFCSCKNLFVRIP
jgi:hypothetical protein